MAPAFPLSQQGQCTSRPQARCAAEAAMPKCRRAHTGRPSTDWPAPAQCNTLRNHVSAWEGKVINELVKMKDDMVQQAQPGPRAVIQQSSFTASPCKPSFAHHRFAAASFKCTGCLLCAPVNGHAPDQGGAARYETKKCRSECRYGDESTDQRPWIQGYLLSYTATQAEMKLTCCTCCQAKEITGRCSV